MSGPFTIANAVTSGYTCPSGYQPVRGNNGLPLSCSPQNFGACGTMNYQCIKCSGIYTCCYVDPYNNRNNNYNNNNNNNLGVRPFVPQSTFGGNYNNLNNNNFGNTGCAANSGYELDFDRQPRFCDSVNGAICGVGFTCTYNSVFQRRTCCQCKIYKLYSNGKNLIT